MRNKCQFKWVVVFLLLSGCIGCASISKDVQPTDPHDPYESFNRKSYRFTDEIDRRYLEPIADAYLAHAPEAVRRPVNNFYRNLSYPGVALNSFLQGKVRQGISDTLRFVINTTVGIFGLADMAGHMGFAENDEDFGQTLAVWGVHAGSYTFIPIYGPSTQRDVADIPFSFFSDGMLFLAYALSGPVLAPLALLRVIDKRASLSGPMKVRDQSALDPYLFVREAFLQQRNFLIYDGKLPGTLYDQLLLDEPMMDMGGSRNDVTLPHKKFLILKK
ncbi:putative lipoprotein (VacJ) transmembrane [Nitrosomonas mobilis]|uniref:Putative lipoprotein (VacJ) transmembrane n=1 Tax=Nitrosomonas mobilis TaxID=51642 RepID=A0A1G5SCD4_9PROT|nr:putative lipoprotein (VacJ) transmembrane [Nitrosomonas mobilis]